MEIFVINLKRSVDRRLRIEARLRALGLAFTIFPAIDASAGEHLRFANYNADACRRVWRKALSPGEIGCMASHFLLWEHCLAIGRPIVILEDDAVLSDPFPEALDMLPQVMARFDYVRLSAFKARPLIPVLRPELKPGWSLVGFRKGPLGMAGYAINPASAAKLVAKAQRWLEPADIYGDHFWLHGVACVGLMPWTVEQDGLDTTIDLRGARRPGLAWQLRRLLRKAADNLLRNVWLATSSRWLYDKWPSERR